MASGTFLALAVVGFWGVAGVSPPVGAAGWPPRAVPPPQAAGLTSRIYDARVIDVGELQTMVLNFDLIQGMYLRNSWCPYLGDAYLVFGCVRRGDTLVAGSPGAHGFTSSTRILESSTDTLSRYYDPQAKAEQQLYSVFDDMPEPPYDLDSLMAAPNGSIGIEVHQTTYAWSDEGRTRSLLVDYWIRNISNRTIQRGAVGIALESWIGCPPVNRYAPDTDNLCGLVRTVPALVPGYVDTLNLAWMADNDGDPQDNPLSHRDVPAALGVRILHAPKGGQFSFNWWAYCWRPVRQFVWGIDYAWGPYGAALSGVPDTMDIRDWYRTMTNGQIDYDQVYTALDMSSLGWARPPANYVRSLGMAGGADSRMLLSYGPLDDIFPGDSVEFTVAFSIGAQFHRDPSNFINRFSPGNPKPYLDHLDFSDLITNARAIEWAFDTPGIDSDTNDAIRYRGEAHLFDCFTSDSGVPPTGCDSVFYRGDGIADFGHPAPPPPPEFSLTTKPGKAILRWDGSRTEFAPNSVTGQRNFEGYRIYAGRGHQEEQLSLVASWDQENFIRLQYDTLADGGWRQISYPYTVTAWRRIIGDSAFDPRDYETKSVDRAYHDTYPDTFRNYLGEVVEVVARERQSCWLPQDANQGNEYLEDGVNETNIIQRVATHDTVIGGHSMTYGSYQAEVGNLQPSVPLYFAVTSFDHGDYVAKLPSLESSPAANWKYGEPIYSADVVIDSGLHVSVYPNPYKIIYNDAFGHRTTYFAEGYEGRGKPEFTEYDRRIHFINLPDTATITIYSLDGDLIRVLYHPDPFLSTYSSSIGWDLVSRNAQAVVSGIYIWRVDSKLGTQIGKIVIIK